MNSITFPRQLTYDTSINNMQHKLILLCTLAASFSKAAANPACTNAQTAAYGDCTCDIDVQSGSPVCWSSANPYTPRETVCQTDSDCMPTGQGYKCTHDHTNRVSYGTDRLCADSGGCPTVKRSLVNSFARAGRIPQKKSVIIMENSMQMERLVQ